MQHSSLPRAALVSKPIIIITVGGNEHAFYRNVLMTKYMMLAFK